MSIARSRALTVAALTVVALAACAGATETGLLAVDTGLPNRIGGADTARISEIAHPDGGNVFITLTGEPTPAALEVLSAAGLEAPAGHADIVTFPNLKIATVAGHVARGTIRRLALLQFVTRIDWTDLAGPIAPLGVTVSIGHPSTGTGATTPAPACPSC